MLFFLPFLTPQFCNHTWNTDCELVHIFIDAEMLSTQWDEVQLIHATPSRKYMTYPLFLKLFYSQIKRIKELILQALQGFLLLAFYTANYRFF